MPILNLQMKWEILDLNLSFTAENKMGNLHKKCFLLGELNSETIMNYAHTVELLAFKDFE